MDQASLHNFAHKLTAAKCVLQSPGQVLDARMDNFSDDSIELPTEHHIKRWNAIAATCTDVIQIFYYAKKRAAREPKET